MTGVWNHIVETAARRSAWPSWLLMFLITLLPTYLAPELQVSALWIAPFVLVMLFIVWILFSATQRALDLAQRDRLPALVAVPKQSAHLILLLQASRLFGQGVAVSIYYEEESSFEKFVATGKVRNIQDNGLIQVEVLDWKEHEAPLLQRLQNEESEAMKRIIVKPAVAPAYAVDPKDVSLAEWLSHFAKSLPDKPEEPEE